MCCLGLQIRSSPATTGSARPPTLWYTCQRQTTSTTHCTAASWATRGPGARPRCTSPCRQTEWQSCTSTRTSRRRACPTRRQERWTSTGSTSWTQPWRPATRRRRTRRPRHCCSNTSSSTEGPTTSLATPGEVLLEPTLTTLRNFLVRSNSQSSGELCGGRLPAGGLRHDPERLNRPVFTSCVPAIDSAFCDCIAPFQKQHHACMTHRSWFPAGLPEVEHSSPRSLFRCMGRTAVAPMPIFALFKQGRLPFARSMREAHTRANLIPASCPAEACTANRSSAAPLVPRATLPCSCMPTSFGPGCIAFAAQAHAQGRVPLHEHATLPTTGMPRRGFPAVGRTACAPTRRSLPCETSHACFLSEQGHSLAHHGVRKTDRHRPYTIGAAAFRSACTADATKV